MNKEELQRKYLIAKEGNYKDIRKEALDYIVNVSKSGLPPEKLQGMLLLIDEIDSWITDYLSAIERERKGN